MSDRDLLHGLILVLVLWAFIGVLSERKGAATLGFGLFILVMLS